MDFTSTKDHYERETEESERLVRPAPKLKPPRHDRRREDMRPGRDPDIDDDPDIAKDKDLSLNHKNIGGSTTQFDLLALRVAGRFVRADLDRSPPAEKSAGGGEDEYVAVVNKETGENTRVKKETLKGPGGAKYKVIKEEGGKKGPSDETVSAVADLAEQNPALKGLLQTLSNPKHKEYATLTAIPQVPLSSLSALKDVQFPEGVKTIGDLHAVAQAAPKKKPEGKPAPGAPAKAPEPKQEAPRAPGPKQEAPEPKTEGAPKEEPKASPPEPWEALAGGCCCAQELAG